MSDPPKTTGPFSLATPSTSGGSNIFDQSLSGASGNSSFGGAKPASSGSGGLFESNNSSSGPTQGLFGSSGTAASSSNPSFKWPDTGKGNGPAATSTPEKTSESSGQQPAKPLFGMSNNTQSGGLFGGTGSGSSALSGGTTPAQNKSGSVFSFPNSSTTPSGQPPAGGPVSGAAPSSLFGASKPQQQQGPGLFGNLASNTNTSQPQSPQASMSNLFGNMGRSNSGSNQPGASKPQESGLNATASGGSQPAPNSQQTPNIFGNLPSSSSQPTPNSQPTSSLFGKTSAAPSSQPSKNLFGNLGSVSGNVTGQGPASASTGSAPSLFGFSSTAAPQPSMKSQPSTEDTPKSPPTKGDTKSSFALPKASQPSTQVAPNSRTTSNLFGQFPATAAPASPDPTSFAFPSLGGASTSKQTATTQSSTPASQASETPTQASAPPAQASTPATQASALGTQSSAPGTQASAPGTSTSATSAFASAGSLFGGASKATEAPATTQPASQGAAAPAASDGGQPATLGTSAAGPRPTAQSRLRNKSMDEIITRWTTDLAKYQKEFQKQAEKVAEWDRMLVDNSDKIQKLYGSTLEAERATVEVERQLSGVENDQSELEYWLEHYERQVDELMSTQLGSGDTLQGPDQERERTYKLAEKLSDRLDEMGKDLTSMIEEINDASASMSKSSKVDDPLSQIVRVLNGHLSQLQQIDKGTTELQAKVANAQKASRSLGSMNGSNRLGSDAADDFYRSYMGRR